MGRIIAFFGPDGSGKTTQADLLAAELRRRGFKVRRAWIKNNHMLAYAAVRLLERLSPRSVVRSPSGAIVAHRLGNGGRLGRILWPWVELVGVLPNVILKAKIPALLGATVVADRYLPDTVVHAAMATGSTRLPNLLPYRIMLSMLGGASLVHVDAAPEAAKARRGELADPISYLEVQRRLYREVVEVTGAPTVDTTELSVAEAHRRVLEVLDPWRASPGVSDGETSRRRKRSITTCASSN